MLKNVFITALRNLRRQKAYALTNVLGLAIGMASCVLILIFLRYEFSIDAHHSRGDRIYKLIGWDREQDGRAWWVRR
jgi:putative ABC transport system permease protein